MIARLSASLFLLLSLPNAIAEDISKPWTSITFNVLHADSAATVTIEGSESLAKVNLSLIGLSMDIPENELEGIDTPQLNTAQLFFGEDWYGEWKEGEEPTPHFIVEMSYGKKSEFGNYPTVRFLFHSGKYQERITSVQTTKTVWKEFSKLPGEEPVLSGTATRPAGNKKPGSMENGE